MQSGRGDHGGTLIEALVAMSLLSVVIVAFFGLYSTGQTAAALAQGLDEASLLAQLRLEEIKAAAACGESPVPQPRQPVDAESLRSYEREVESQELQPGLYQVTVTVYWTFQNIERRMDLTTYVRVRRGGLR